MQVASRAQLPGLREGKEKVRRGRGRGNEISSCDEREGERERLGSSRELSFARQERERKLMPGKWSYVYRRNREKRWWLQVIEESREGNRSLAATRLVDGAGWLAAVTLLLPIMAWLRHTRAPPPMAPILCRAMLLSLLCIVSRDDREIDLKQRTLARSSSTVPAGSSKIFLARDWMTIL